MDLAAEYGHVDILQYLYCMGNDCTKRAMDFAAQNGHLDVLKYLHSIGKQCSANAMDLAAGNGLITSIMYLHSLGAGCSSQAMDWAAEFGHDKVLEFLGAHYPNECAFTTMVESKYIPHSGRTERTKNAMLLAASNGHLNVIKYLYFDVPVRCRHLIGAALNRAIQNEHLSIISFLSSLLEKSDSRFI